MFPGEGGGGLWMGLGAIAVLSAPAGAHAQAYRFHDDHVLGSSLDMIAVADDPAAALTAARAVRAEIARLDALLSVWRPDSELSALNRAQRMTVSPDLFRVIKASETWRAATGGAFDARLGRLGAAWRQAGANGAPSPSALRNLIAEARAVDVGLDGDAVTVTRPSGAVFDVDGLGKGYVIDRALAAARRQAPGLEGLMIDIGGDVRVWGKSPGQDGWRLGIANPDRLHDNAAPAQVVRLSEGALAFSGPGLRDLVVHGRPRSHILDPATGRPAGTLSAAVTGPAAVHADALATALCAMDPARGLALVNRMDAFEAVIIDDSGRRRASDGWTGLAAPIEDQARRAHVIRAQAPRAAAWPSGYEVAVGYELPMIEGRRIHAPYVAVWVTDQNGAPLRILSLLGDDLRYIDQNFIWWRRVGRVTDHVDAIAKPTRRPGRYSVVWDGRDADGAKVPQGRYTIHIEAVREHGGHSYQSFDVSLGAKPLDAVAVAEAELGAATLRYGPRR